MTVERSQKLLITNEARVLKTLREARGMSMQEAAKAIGKSKPYIAHIEGGRMNVPQGDKLMQILAAYGITSYKVYYDKVRTFRVKTTQREELDDLLGRFPEEKVSILLRLAKAMTEGKAIVVF